jgi:hypothetical protein
MWCGCAAAGQQQCYKWAQLTSKEVAKEAARRCSCTFGTGSEKSEKSNIWEITHLSLQLLLLPLLLRWVCPSYESSLPLACAQRKHEGASTQQQQHMLSGHIRQASGRCTGKPAHCNGVCAAPASWKNASNYDIEESSSKLQIGLAPVRCMLFAYVGAGGAALEGLGSLTTPATRAGRLAWKLSPMRGGWCAYEPFSRFVCAFAAGSLLSLIASRSRGAGDLRSLL